MNLGRKLKKHLSFSKKWKFTLFFLFILTLLGFFLRFQNYDTYPRHGATFDEFAWTWQGINLIQKGVPISWSSQPQYTDRRHLIYQGAAFWIVKPYLEHPPLFGLVAGSFALLHGTKDMYFVTLHTIRQLSLLLGILSIFSFFLFLSMIYEKKIAILGSILYATIPTIVIGSRIVQNENFLIPLWLLSLCCILQYLQKHKRVFFYFAAIIAGLLSLAKVPWLVVAVSLSMILSYKGKWKDAILLFLITIGFFAIYLLYGFYFDKDLFIALWKLQVARYDIVFSGFFSTFTNPLLVDWKYLDGWIYAGWFTILLLCREFKKHYFILIPFFAYFVLYTFAIPDEPAHGWYRYPFYPFLLASLTVVFVSELKKFSLVTPLSFLVIGFSLLGNVWQEAFGFSYLVYRVFILGVSLPAIYLLWKNSNKQKLYVYGWLIVFIIFNIFAILIYKE